MLKVKVNAGTEFTVEAQGTEGEINGKPYLLDLLQIKEGTFHALRDGKSYTIEVLKRDLQNKTFLLLVNGNKYQLELKDKYDDLLQRLGMNMSAKVVKEIKAPMPGMVLELLVEEGGTVAKDQPLLVLEAMKMENVLKSPAEGKIKSIHVIKGNAVEKNQALISFE